MIRDVLDLPNGQKIVPGNRWDLLEGVAAPEPPALSVIIPYYRERAQLELVLAGLYEQDHPADRFEIIVADDGSPEPLTLPAPAAGPRLRVVRQPDLGFRAAAARNLGASVAEGDVLCFLDQDTVPEPGYLRAITRLPAVAPDVLTVGRRRHAELTGWSPERIGSWMQGTGPAPRELSAPGWLADAYRESRDLLDADDGSYRFVISSVMCLTTRLFRELGGFDEQFTRYGGEDWELANRAWRAGAVFAHVRDAVAWHDGPDWAGRGDDAEREAEKTHETNVLARLIPAADSGGLTEPGSRPADLVVAWTGTASMDADELRAALSELQESRLNLVVQLDPGEAARLGSPSLPVVSSRDDSLARARYAIEVHGETDLSSVLLERIRAAMSADVSRIEVSDLGTPLTLTSLRARNRVRRWQAVFSGQDLESLLFDVTIGPARPAAVSRPA